MAKRYGTLFAWAMMLSAVSAGCSTFLTSDVPVDCDLVRTQHKGGPE